METRLTVEMMDALAQPFEAEAVHWKPGAVTKDGTKALALAYVDARGYQERLDQVCGPDWSDDFEVVDGGKVVVCRLTLAGVTRCDVGEADPNDANTVTSAAAQSFKRSCAKFGLGRYLYNLPRVWVEYDAQRRRFTNAALAQLQRSVSSSIGSDNGDLRVPAGPRKGMTLSWLLANDRDYLEKIASSAQDAALRDAARELLHNGRG